MSTAGDAFNVIKRVLLITEDMARLSGKVDKLADHMEQYEHRLIRIEATLAILTGNAAPSRGIILPGE